MSKVLTKPSFLSFIYPFNFEPGLFETLALKVSSVTFREKRAENPAVARPDGQTFPPYNIRRVWQEDSFLDHELLPHLSRYLGDTHGEPKNYQARTGLSWKMRDEALQAAEVLGGDQTKWILRTRGAGTKVSREIAFTFDALKLFLFRGGVGMVVLKVSPITCSLDDWYDFVSHCRYIGSRQEIITAKPTLAEADLESIEYFAVEPRNRNVKAASGNAGHIVKGILRQLYSPPFDGRTDADWWEGAFIPGQLMHFHSVFIDDNGAGYDTTTSNEERWKPFFDLQYAMGAQSRKVPTKHDLRPDNPIKLEFTEGQWFLFGLKGGGFIAFNSSEKDFLRRNPETIFTQYFHLFILTLYQRFALTYLSSQVAENIYKESAKETTEGFKRIREAFLSFNAHGYFTSVIQRDFAHSFYRRWQEIFESDRLFDEVRGEVGEISEWLQVEATKRFENRISGFGLFFMVLSGVASLVIGYLGVEKEALGLSLRATLLITLASLCVSGIIAWIAWIRLREK